MCNVLFATALMPALNGTLSDAIVGAVVGDRRGATAVALAGGAIDIVSENWNVRSSFGTSSMTIADTTIAITSINTIESHDY